MTPRCFSLIAILYSAQARLVLFFLTYGHVTISFGSVTYGGKTKPMNGGAGHVGVVVDIRNFDYPIKPGHNKFGKNHEVSRLLDLLSIFQSRSENPFDQTPHQISTHKPKRIPFKRPRNNVSVGLSYVNPLANGFFQAQRSDAVQRCLAGSGVAKALTDICS